MHRHILKLSGKFLATQRNKQKTQQQQKKTHKHTTSVVHVCINLGHNISSMDVYSPYLSLENTKKNHKNKHVGDIE